MISTRAVAMVFTAGCLTASPIRAQSVARDTGNSCQTFLLHALALTTEIGARPTGGAFAAAITRVVDSTVPRTLRQWAPPDARHELRLPAQGASLHDTLVTRLEALIRQQSDTLVARRRVAMVLADLLRGAREPTQFQTSIVELAYQKMRLPPGPAEAVARDLTLGLDRRWAALNAVSDAPVDSSLVDAIFVNFCQVGTWAAAMPLSDSIPLAMPAAITEWGEAILQGTVILLTIDARELRPLAPCKSFRECFPRSPALLAWLRRYSEPDPGY